MSFLEITQLAKSYKSKDTTFSIKDLSLSLEKGETLALLGESGCGKTTVLKMIAGFVEVDAGSVVLENKTLVKDHFKSPIEEREIGFVFQNYALFPHLTVENNLFYGRTTKSKKEVLELASWLGIQEHLSKYPHQLSGGQQQRVAMARTLATNPKLLCLDEPLSNIDEGLKKVVRMELRKLIKEQGITSIIVSHDMKDAVQLADKIAVLKDGILQQIGTVQELFEQPKNAYVAKLMGNWQLLESLGDEEVYVSNLSVGKGINQAKVLSQHFEGTGYALQLNFNGEILTATSQEKVGEMINFDYTKKICLKVNS